MKKILIFSTVALFLSVLFYSCAKEEVISKDIPSEKSLQTQNLNSLLSNTEDLETTGKSSAAASYKICGAKDLSLVRNINGMLYFRDLGHHERIYNCLEYRKEKHMVTFENATVGMSPSQIDNYEEMTGWDENQPLIDFENSLGFSSRRKLVESQIVAWLENSIGDLDLDQDPDDSDYLDEELRTLLTHDGKVSVGGQILDYLEGANFTSDEVGNSSFSSSSVVTPCLPFRKKKDDEEYVDELKKIKVKVRTAHWPWLGKSLSKIINFKRKNNGGWKRDRATLRASLGGQFRKSDCEDNIPAGAFKSFKFRKKRKVKFHIWGMNEWTSAFQGEVSGCGEIQDANLTICLILD